MNFYRPIHFFFGEYVFICGKSDFSRLANIASQRKLHFWSIRTEGGSVAFCASVFSAEAISLLARESSVPLEIRAKRGMPFLFSKYRKRYGLILGLFLGMFLLLWSQLFVWKITVSGNTSVKTSEIERELAQCGVGVGSYIPSISTRADANRLLMQLRELSSCAISINGTHINVSVLERTKIPDIVSTKGFFNVVAECDGVIVDVNAANGTPEVNEGDVVYKGELLINSFIEGKNGSFRPTHARGTVFAAVSREFISEIPLSRVTKVYTGNSETKRIYTVMGREANIFGDAECDYEYFDAVATEKTVKLFGFIELPVRVFSVTYNEYELESAPINEATAELLAREELADFISETDLEMLSCDTEFICDKEKGVCRLTANAVFIKDIAIEIPFEILNYRISERFPNATE